MTIIYIYLKMYSGLPILIFFARAKDPNLNFEAVQKTTSKVRLQCDKLLRTLFNYWTKSKNMQVFYSFHLPEAALALRLGKNRFGSMNTKHTAPFSSGSPALL